MSEWYKPVRSRSFFEPGRVPTNILETNNICFLEPLGRGSQAFRLLLHCFHHQWCLQWYSSRCHYHRESAAMGFIQRLQVHSKLIVPVFY